MSAPPGSLPTSSLNLQANGEGSSEFLSPRVVTREAAKILGELEIEMRPARLRILVTRFIELGRTDVDLRTYILGYSDPTGEAAVRNVMRGVR